MTAQISIATVNMDAESSNLVEMTVSDGKTVRKPQNTHPVIRLNKQECNHGTCLVFPNKAADK